MDDVTILFGIAAVGLAYIFFRRRLDSYVLPARLEAASLGELLSKDVSIPHQARAAINLDLNWAFSPWPMVAFVVLIPVTFVLAALRIGPKEDKLPSDVTADLSRYRWAIVRSWAAANPIFALLACLELLVLAPLFILLHVTTDRVADALIATTNSFVTWGQKLHRA
jgi:hypothetical protein